jgi:hypothetical protein
LPRAGMDGKVPSWVLRVNERLWPAVRSEVHISNTARKGIPDI